MTLQAKITNHDGTAWLYVTAPGKAADMRFVLYDGPLDLTSKASIKAEIDWAHDKTGIPRPDLYDTVRAYQNQQRRSAA